MAESIAEKIDTVNICSKGENSNNIDDGVCLPTETVFVDTKKTDDDIFDELKVKVEPSYMTNDEEELLLALEDVETQDEDKGTKKTRKKKKDGKEKLAASKQKTKLIKKTRKRGRTKGDSDRSVDGSVEETLEERRRRLARERLRRKRANMNDVERLIATRRQRIQKQKLRIRRMLQETEEEAEDRRQKAREQKRKSRERLKEMELMDKESLRLMSASPNHEETKEERIRRLGRARQRRYRLKLTKLELLSVEDKLRTNEDIQYIREAKHELELRKLRQKLLSKENRQQMQQYVKDVSKPSTSVKKSDDDFIKSNVKKRAPGDIEYLFFYENSKERRMRLDKERRVAQYMARRQMELEYLALEEECDTETSQRCLDID